MKSASFCADGKSATAQSPPPAPDALAAPPQSSASARMRACVAVSQWTPARRLMSPRMVAAAASESMGFSKKWSTIRRMASTKAHRSGQACQACTRGAVAADRPDQTTTGNAVIADVVYPGFFAFTDVSWRRPEGGTLRNGKDTVTVILYSQRVDFSGFEGNTDPHWQRFTLVSGGSANALPDLPLAE